MWVEVSTCLIVLWVSIFIRAKEGAASVSFLLADLEWRVHCFYKQYYYMNNQWTTSFLEKSSVKVISPVPTAQNVHVF